MPEERDEEAAIIRAAIAHRVSLDVARSAFKALKAGGGRMAQFSHPEFGGVCHWAPDMATVGDLFDAATTAKLDGLCRELAPLALRAAERSKAHERHDLSYRTTGADRAWWPGSLGIPDAVGMQNGLRYAAFAQARRLVVEDHGRMTVYDSGPHRISGVSHAQGAGQSLTFVSQLGLVRVSSLAVVLST